MMVAPPLDEGAVNAILALALPAVAAPIVGAPDTAFELTLLLPPPHAVNVIAIRHRNGKTGCRFTWWQPEKFLTRSPM